MLIILSLTATPGGIGYADVAGFKETIAQGGEMVEPLAIGLVRGQQRPFRGGDRSGLVAKRKRGSDQRIVGTAAQDWRQPQHKPVTQVTMESGAVELF